MKKSFLYCLIYTLVCLFLMLWSSLSWAACGGSSPNWTAASAALSDVQDCINGSSDGDTITIPNGEATWGTGGEYLDIDVAGITIEGESKAGVVITLAEDGSNVIRMNAASIFKSVSIIGATNNGVTAFTTGASGWVIEDIAYTGIHVAYFAYINGYYGVIANNQIEGGGSTAELIYVKGPTDSWQTANSIGGADNVFIEGNTFSGQGYVSDCNANSRCVARYNTITGPIKIDGHGKCSNTPARGVREMEIYNNLWTMNTTATRIEFRGGTGRIFNNHRDYSGGTGLQLREYSAFQTCGSFSEVCQCPEDYPIDDQIGVGIDPKSAHSEPLYLWNNTQTANNDQWVASIKDDAIPGQCAECGYLSFSEIILEGRDYYESESKPAAMSGYTPYTCPHPDTGLTGECNPNVAGTDGYNTPAQSSDTSQSIKYSSTGHSVKYSSDGQVIKGE